MVHFPFPEQCIILFECMFSTVNNGATTVTNTAPLICVKHYWFTPNINPIVGTMHKINVKPTSAANTNATLTANDTIVTRVQ